MNLLITILFFINIKCSESKSMDNSIYVCTNTFVDNLLSDFVTSISNNAFNYENSTYNITKIVCPSDCEDMTHLLQTLVSDEGYYYNPYIIGYWNNITYLSCLSPSLKQYGLHLFNICPLTSICEYNVYTSYHPQSLILNLMNIVIDYPPLSLIYYNLTNLNPLLHVTKNFFTGLLLPQNIHIIYNTNEYFELKNIDDIILSNGIIYIINEENSGLDEFIEFIISLKSQPTVFLVGYFNNNLKNNLTKLNKFYIISPYFPYINERMNNEMKIVIQNDNPTFDTAILYIYIYIYIIII